MGVCTYGICNVWVCVCMGYVRRLCVCVCVCVCKSVGFVMCGCVYVWVLQCVVVCTYGLRNVWVCVCVDFAMCGCVYVWVLQCVGVLVICVPVFTVFCIVFFYVHLFYLILV